MNIEIKSGVYTRNDESVPFNFYTSLSAYNKMKFVDSVVSALVTEDGYNYVVKDMLFDFMIINLFTDIDVSEITETSNNIDAIEDFLDETNIVEIVKMNALRGVIDELEKAVELNIEYKTGIHINPISSSLSSLLDTIERKVNSIDLEEMMGVAESMAGISDELTAEKIIDAYAKTDIFKKNWSQLEDDKRKRDAAMEVVENNAVNVVDGNKNILTTPILSPTFEV